MLRAVIIWLKNLKLKNRKARVNKHLKNSQQIKVFVVHINAFYSYKLLSVLDDKKQRFIILNYMSSMKAYITE